MSRHAAKGGKANPYQKNDAFTQRAKKAGYPARSVFKLEEIDKRAQILKAGQNVLDLGASPGSWAMYAASKIGKAGRLLAVDLSPLQTMLPVNAEFIQGDAFALDDEKLARFAPYDVVLSDMAPATSGTPMQDQARSVDLFLRALAVAEKYTKPGGSFIGKIFMGEDFPSARAEVRKVFEKERLIRPESVRSVSFEIFVVGTGRRVPDDGTGRRAPDPESEGA